MDADRPHAGADGRGHLADQPGIEGRAQASGVGKMVAVQAAKPVRHSSCATAGIPNLLAAIMTNGGPGYTTRVLSLDMHQAAFSQNEFGYASVLAVVLGVVGVGIALGLVRFSGFGSMASQQEGAA